MVAGRQNMRLRSKQQTNSPLAIECLMSHLETWYVSKSVRDNKTEIRQLRIFQDPPLNQFLLYFVQNLFLLRATSKQLF